MGLNPERRAASELIHGAACEQNDHGAGEPGKPCDPNTPLAVAIAQRRARLKCGCDSIVTSVCRRGRPLSTNPDCQCPCHARAAAERS